MGRLGSSDITSQKPRPLPPAVLIHQAGVQLLCGCEAGVSLELVHEGQPSSPPRGSALLGLPQYSRAGGKLRVSDTVASKLQTMLLDLVCHSRHAVIEVDVPHVVLP